jgi:hypothetical protein
MQMIGFNALDKELSYWDEDGEIGTFMIKAGKAITVSFSQERFCKGYFDGKRNFMCQYHVPGVSQCPACREKDITRLYACADERGFEEKFEELKDLDYSVYLALFGTKVKCGVARAERLHYRALEQGTRHYAEVARVRGMKDAYAIETYLQRAYGFANSARSSEKLNEHDDVSALEKGIAAMKGDGYVGGRLIYTPAIMHNAIPSFQDALHSDSISGKVLCTRASLVFFLDFAVKYADLSAKKGYGITELAC